ncbi:MAG: hypothetical protein L3K26_18785, partial [Candidatus Hydrogenedentes bacterium]|nr:hypothetical protein [Candidatus Hydrogenedentota bacterium]
NGGERLEPTLVDRIQDRFGRTIYRHDKRDCIDCASPALVPGTSPSIRSNRSQVMDPITAYQLTSMMQGVVQRGTLFSQSPPLSSRPATAVQRWWILAVDSAPTPFLPTSNPARRWLVPACAPRRRDASPHGPCGNLGGSRRSVAAVPGELLS